jgi:hypothetical protein
LDEELGIGARSCGSFGPILPRDNAALNAPDVGTALEDLLCHLDLHDRRGVGSLATRGTTRERDTSQSASARRIDHRCISSGLKRRTFRKSR